MARELICQTFVKNTKIEAKFNDYFRYFYATLLWCYSIDLCFPVIGYNSRFTCSTPTTSTPVTSTYSFSLTTENTDTSENYLNTTGTSGLENSIDDLAATSPSAQETTVVGKNVQLLFDALRNKESQLAKSYKFSFTSMIQHGYW